MMFNVYCSPSSTASSDRAADVEWPNRPNKENPTKINSNNHLESESSFWIKTKLKMLRMNPNNNGNNDNNGDDQQVYRLPLTER